MSHRLQHGQSSPQFHDCYDYDLQQQQQQLAHAQSTGAFLDQQQHPNQQQHFVQSGTMVNLGAPPGRFSTQNTRQNVMMQHHSPIETQFQTMSGSSSAYASPSASPSSMSRWNSNSGYYAPPSTPIQMRATSQLTPHGTHSREYVDQLVDSYERHIQDLEDELHFARTGQGRARSPMSMQRRGFPAAPPNSPMMSPRGGMSSPIGAGGLYPQAPPNTPLTLSQAGGGVPMTPMRSTHFHQYQEGGLQFASPTSTPTRMTHNNGSEASFSRMNSDTFGASPSPSFTMRGAGSGVYAPPNTPLVGGPRARSPIHGGSFLDQVREEMMMSPPPQQQHYNMQQQPQQYYHGGGNMMMGRQHPFM